MKKLVFLFLLASSLSFGGNLLENPGFESGLDKWTAAGAEFELSNHARTGTNAVKVTVSDQKYNGIRPNKTKIELVPGTYSASFWVKAGNAATEGKKASIKIESNIGSALTESSSVILSASEWRQALVTFTVTATDSVKFMIRANNAEQSGMLMYVDDAELGLSVVPYIYNGGFENTPYDDGWSPVSGATIAEENSTVHSGNSAVKITVATSGKGVRANSYIEGHEARAYVASAWVKGTLGHEVKIQMQVKDSEETTQYLTKGANDVLHSGNWQHISIPFAVASTGSGGYRFNFQPQNTGTYYIDDVEIDTIPTLSMFLNGSMEQGAEKYYSLALKNGAEASIYDETSDVQNQNHAMRVNVGTAGEAWGDVEIQTSSLIPISTPKTVSFYAKYEGDEAGSAGLAFSYKDEIGKGITDGGGSYNGRFLFTNTYRKYSYSVASPENSALKYMLPAIRCGEKSGDYYFDNISVTEYDGVTPNITSTALTTARANDTYTYAPIANKEGGLWKVDVTNTAGLSNAWLKVDTYSGKLSGTPMENGTFAIALTYSDGIAEKVQTFDLTVSTSTSLGKDTEAVFAMFPNPTGGILNITGVKAGAEVKIYNLMGQLVRQLRLINTSLDLSDLRSGVYFLQIENDVQRFVIQD